MTDHYAGAAEQLARDLARVKDARDRLREYREQAVRLLNEQAAEMDQAAEALNLCRWLADLDKAPNVGAVTLTQVCNKARAALARVGEYPPTDAYRLSVEVERLRAQLAEAQVTIRALAGVPNPSDPIERRST